MVMTIAGEKSANAGGGWETWETKDSDAVCGTKEDDAILKVETVPFCLMPDGCLIWRWCWMVED